MLKLMVAFRGLNNQHSLHKLIQLKKLRIIFACFKKLTAIAMLAREFQIFVQQQVNSIKLARAHSILKNTSTAWDTSRVRLSLSIRASNALMLSAREYVSASMKMSIIVS